uniref:HipA domain-containing protein n=1 Tax=Agathobacter sp. TaxID=2021311 RepID=UPI004055E0C4
MRRLSVFIEINGESVYVGEIVGKDSNDACFTYAEAYLENPEHRAISIGLPLEVKTFDAKRTRIFFEGLLPEGFTRRCVAEWMHMDENDYVSILAGLGRECLGAIKIVDESDEAINPEYRELSSEEVYALASEGATESAELVTKSHLSLTGASGKVGLYFDEKEGKWYLPIGEAPSTHIVKQSHVRLKKIVANEQLCLLTAKNLGIDIPESFIVTTDGDDESVLFATKRYDRKFIGDDKVLNGMPVPRRLHQEDFAQALGIAAASKYEKNNEGYLKLLFDVIRLYSADPMTDSLKLWDICVFNYLIGNTDNHIKNISLLYSEDLKSIRLAPAYDIVSTMIYKSSTENMALSIDGLCNINEITRASFEKAAAQVGIGPKMAMKRFDAMVNGFVDAINQAKEELKGLGFEHVEQICEMIMEKGGIRKKLR